MVLVPVRELGVEAETVSTDSLREVTVSDLHSALKSVASSVDSSCLRVLSEWNQSFGTTR